MRDSLTREIEEKAHFVAGKQAWFRNNTDPGAQEGARNAESFLSGLPEKIGKPVVSAGTTTNPDVIVALTWFVSGYDTIRSVSVSFRENGHCDVSWDEPSGAQRRVTDIPLSNVTGLDVSGKVEDLMNRAPKTGLEKPHYS